MTRAGRISTAVFSRAEYVYYAVICYSLLSEYLGIEVPLLAAGTTVALAVYCYRQLGPHALPVLRPVGLLLACTGTFTLIQLGFHDVPLSDSLLRAVVLWTCSVVIAQILSLRQGFALRCTLVLTGIALIALPNLGIDASGSVERATAAVARWTGGWCTGGTWRRRTSKGATGCGAQEQCGR